MADIDLAGLSDEFPFLDPTPVPRNDGSTSYRIEVPKIPPERSFGHAELIVPTGFPDSAAATIRLSEDAVLRIPHVDANGTLCIDGDPGPDRSDDATDRLSWLLRKYHNEFLKPWVAGALDGDFAKEPVSYWHTHIAREQNKPLGPFKEVWTVGERPAKPRLIECPFLMPTGFVLVGGPEDRILVERVVRSLGYRAKQLMRVLVAEIPITDDPTPKTWPRTPNDILYLLRANLSSEDWGRLKSSIETAERGIHCLVLLRHQRYGLAYLLPGGQPIQTQDKNRRKAHRPSKKTRPLNAVRVDPAWTVGRDQISEVSKRQQKRVVVFGAGALGSPIVDQLAKAGVGIIDLVDPQSLETANIGRHLLGIDDVGSPKAAAVAARINQAYPSCEVHDYQTSAEAWLIKNGLSEVDAAFDLTGEPVVQWSIDKVRRKTPRPLLVGWMEPFVAAAHVCVLPRDTFWLLGDHDAIGEFGAVTWPPDVIVNEPGCSSRFQSYTAAAATHAVALTAEQALRLLDGEVDTAKIHSWVRGQSYLDAHRPGLKLREWAKAANPHAGLLIERDFPAG